MKKQIFFSVLTALTLQIAHAQWTEKSAGLSASQLIFEISASGKNNCYGNIYDSITGSFINKIAITHDGGENWQTVTIDSLENNIIIDVYACGGNVVHALGWNFLTGGGNVFKSKDGGQTWAREASEAYTNAASFPDCIAFFNTNDGLIFGDPVKGKFEIYTTHDRGNHWHKISSDNIPPPLENEYSSNNYMEIQGNSAWVITYVSDDGGITPAHTRLLQSDDKGKTWYVRNASLPIESTFAATVKFRDHSNGLLSNNGKLFRTTDGGTTFNEVNYSGTFFYYDLDFVKNIPGCWISTGAGEMFGTNAGSSITYDDGDSWTTIDTGVAHFQVQMVNSHHGYTGGLSSGNGTDGVFVYSGSGLKVNDQSARCDKIEFNIYPNPTSESFSLLLTSAPNEISDLLLYDMQGRLVLEEKFSSNETFSFGRDLTPGLYLVQIISGNEKHSERLIKE